MKKLIIATNNSHKVKEIREILGDYYDDVISLKDAGINIEVVEDGNSFHENAFKKASQISMLVDCDVLADDSGLCVDALNGAPGIYSARYAGEKSTDEDNLLKLLADLEGIENRKAKFVCAIVVANGGKEKLYIEEYAHGVITKEVLGEGGFGYDPIFLDEKLNKTFAQIDGNTKNIISHRAKALSKLKETL